MATNNFSDFQGAFKRVYGPEIIEAVPDHLKVFFDAVPFLARNKAPGEAYFEPVQLTVEQGITVIPPEYSGSQITYNTPTGTVVAQAKFDAFEILNQALVPTELVARSLNNDGAFKQATKLIMKSLIEGHRYRQAINLLYGQDNVGVVSGAPSGLVVTFTAGSFAAGVWAGLMGARVSFYTSDMATLRVATTVTAMDLQARTVTLAAVTGIADTDVCVLTDSYNNSGTSWNELIGMSKILTTSSGNLFNISTTTYNLWKPNQYALNGAITQNALDVACTYSMNKGYMGDMTLWIHPTKFSVLVAEQAARMVNYSPTKEEILTGYQSMKLRTQVGTVTIIGHPMIKPSIGFLLANDTWHRVGAADIQMGGPLGGMPDIQMLQTGPYYQLLSYSQSAVFTDHPGWNTIITGIS